MRQSVVACHTCPSLQARLLPCPSALLTQSHTTLAGGRTPARIGCCARGAYAAYTRRTRTHGAMRGSACARDAVCTLAATPSAAEAERRLQQAHVAARYSCWPRQVACCAPHALYCVANMVYYVASSVLLCCNMVYYVASSGVPCCNMVYCVANWCSMAQRDTARDARVVVYTWMVVGPRTRRAWAHACTGLSCFTPTATRSRRFRERRALSFRSARSRSRRTRSSRRTLSSRSPRCRRALAHMRGGAGLGRRGSKGCGLARRFACG